jgi:hypothetical protein
MDMVLIHMNFTVIVCPYKLVIPNQEIYFPACNHRVNIIFLHMGFN